MNLFEKPRGEASELRHEEEWEEEEEEGNSSLVGGFSATLSLLFGGLLLLLVGPGLPGDRSGLKGGSGSVLKSLLKVFSISLTETCVGSRCPGKEAEELDDHSSYP